MPELLIDSKRCKSCGFCVEACPKNVLEIGQEMNANGYPYAVAAREEDCIACKSCSTICPEAAIEIWK